MKVCQAEQEAIRKKAAEKCYNADGSLLHVGECTAAERQPSCEADHYLATDGKCWPKVNLFRPIEAPASLKPKVNPPIAITITPHSVPTVNPATAVVPTGSHSGNCSDITDANHPSSGSCPSQAASFLQTARAAPRTPGKTNSTSGYNFLMAAEALRAAGDFIQLVAVLQEAGLPIPDKGAAVKAFKSLNNSPAPIPPYVSDQCIRVGVPKQLMATDHWTYTYSTRIYASGLKGCPTVPSYSYAPNDKYSYDIGVVLHTDGPPDLAQIHAAPDL